MFCNKIWAFEAGLLYSARIYVVLHGRNMLHIIYKNAHLTKNPKRLHIPYELETAILTRIKKIKKKQMS